MSTRWAARLAASSVSYRLSTRSAAPGYLLSSVWGAVASRNSAPRAGQAHAVQAAGVARAVQALVPAAGGRGRRGGQQAAHQRRFAAPRPGLDEPGRLVRLVSRRAEPAAEAGGRKRPKEKIEHRCFLHRGPPPFAVSAPSYARRRREVTAFLRRVRVGVGADFVDFVAQRDKIAESQRFVVGVAQQRRRGCSVAMNSVPCLSKNLPWSLVTEKPLAIICCAATRPRQTTILGAAAGNCWRSQGMQAALSSGSGSRFCGGRHLTMLAIKMFLSRARSIASR